MWAIFCLAFSWYPTDSFTAKSLLREGESGGVDGGGDGRHQEQRMKLQWRELK